MNIEVHINTNEATSHEFAQTSVVCSQLGLESNVDIDLSALAGQFVPGDIVEQDLLFLAAVVYAVDKLIPRKLGSDGWTRNLNLTIPVRDAANWNNTSETINDCLSFLTGDLWSLTFVERVLSIYRPKPRRLPSDNLVAFGPHIVSLFSGGLDSLIGVINWLSTNEGRIVLVGHHDKYGGPSKAQQQLHRAIEQQNPDRTRLLQV